MPKQKLKIVAKVSNVLRLFKEYGIPRTYWDKEHHGGTITGRLVDVPTGHGVNFEKEGYSCTFHFWDKNLKPSADYCYLAALALESKNLIKGKDFTVVKFGTTIHMSNATKVNSVLEHKK